MRGRGLRASIMLFGLRREDPVLNEGKGVGPSIVAVYQPAECTTIWVNHWSTLLGLWEAVCPPPPLPHPPTCPTHRRWVIFHWIWLADLFNRWSFSSLSYIISENVYRAVTSVITMTLWNVMLNLNQRGNLQLTELRKLMHLQKL